MQVSRWVAGFVGLVCGVSLAADPAPAQAVTVIRAGTLIDGVSEPMAREFPYMVQLGMTPMQAIQSATSRPAEMLGMKGQLGVIAPGALADVIAVSGDPLKDVKVLEKVVFVMKDGNVFRSTQPSR